MRIVVIGLGKVGRALTAQLTAENNDIVVIDQNPDLIEDIGLSMQNLPCRVLICGLFQKILYNP